MPEPVPSKSVTFQEEYLVFHSPNDKDTVATSSSSGIRQHDARDLNVILKEAEQRSLERDANNREKLDELRGIVIKLAQDHFQQQDGQFEEGQNEDGSYTEEQLAR